jgi:hypothetical protein
VLPRSTALFAVQMLLDCAGNHFEGSTAHYCRARCGIHLDFELLTHKF